MAARGNTHAVRVRWLSVNVHTHTFAWLQEVQCVHSDYYQRQWLLVAHNDGHRAVRLIIGRVPRDIRQATPAMRVISCQSCEAVHLIRLVTATRLPDFGQQDLAAPASHRAPLFLKSTRPHDVGVCCSTLNATDRGRDTTKHGET